MPGELQVIERNVVRMVVLDADEQLLLFHTHDPVNPDLGQWWELPGGGIEVEETYQTAAVRELHEETGILIDTGQVGPAIWRRRATFRHRHRCLVQNELIVAVRLATSCPAVDESARLDYEKEDYFDFAWWPVVTLAVGRQA